MPKFDNKSIWAYNTLMNKTNDILQWVGVVFIVAGHILNSMGNMDPYNIIAFSFGTVFFLTWAYRVRNNAQMVVNVVSVVICLLGLYRAF
jgi:hypothetical protein